MGTMTITTSASDDARLAAAFGKYLNLGTNATGPQIKAAIIAFAVNVVLTQEQQAATSTATATALAGLSPPITPT